GGYILRDSGKRPSAIVVATGSEVQLAMRAADQLSGDGVNVRVVSMPCVEVFERQPAVYRESVLPRGIPIVTVEAGATRGWWQYAGQTGAVIGIDRFGKSARDKELWAYFDLTSERIVRTVRDVLECQAAAPLFGAGPVEARQTSR